MARPLLAPGNGRSLERRSARRILEGKKGQGFLLLVGLLVRPSSLEPV